MTDTYTKRVIKKLKTKFPVIHDKFIKGEADLSILIWIIDNIDLVRDKKEAFNVIKETKLLEVKKDGTHIYKEITND